MFWQPKYVFYKSSMALDIVLNKIYETIIVNKRVEPWNFWFVIINCICSCTLSFGCRWGAPELSQEEFFWNPSYWCHISFYVFQKKQWRLTFFLSQKFGSPRPYRKRVVNALQKRLVSWNHEQNPQFQSKGLDRLWEV